MAELQAIDKGRTVLMVLDMHRDVVAADGASKDSGAPEHAASQNVVENIKTLIAAAAQERHDHAPHPPPQGRRAPGRTAA